MSNERAGSNEGRNSRTEPSNHEINRLLNANEHGSVTACRGQTRPQENTEEDFRRLFDYFVSLGPPHFTGEGGYRAAGEWLAAIRSRLTICRALPDQQVQLASYCMSGVARFWWEGVKRNFEGDMARICWIWFEEQFEIRFMSPMHRESMRVQFVNLRQLGRPVAYYNNLFLTLAQYAPDIHEDAFRYRRQYLNGLDPEIAQVVDNPSIQGMQALMDAAKQAEFYCKRMIHQKVNRNVRRRGKITPKKSSVPTPFNKSARPSYERIWCKRCQLPHAESKCRHLNQSCFRCGKSDHWAKDCPIPAPTTSQGSVTFKTSSCRGGGPLVRRRGVNRGGRTNTGATMHVTDPMKDATQEMEISANESTRMKQKGPSQVLAGNRLANPTYDIMGSWLCPS